MTQPTGPKEAVPAATDAAVAEAVAEAEAAYPEKMEGWSIHLALEEAFKIVVATNGYVEQTAPFKLAKDESQTARLDSVLYHMAEALAHVSVLLEPVMPVMSVRMREQLGWALPAGFTLKDLKWGMLQPGHQLGTGSPLFPRVELAEKE